jgi:hypothetical protein
MTKPLIFLICLIISSCEGNFLGKDEYFEYNLINTGKIEVDLFAFKENLKIKSINLKPNQLIKANLIYNRDAGNVDPFFYPDQADSIVLVFKDSKIVSYRTLYSGDKIDPTIKSFLEFNFKEEKSRKWNVSLVSTREINEIDYLLAK